MASEPLLMAIWEDVKTSLEGMSKANGYWFNYGPVEEDKEIPWDAAADYEIPPIVMAYAGEAEQDQISGGETAAKRFTRYDGIVVAIPVKDAEGYHSRRAFRMRADVHKALMATTSAQVTAGGFERSRGTTGRAGTSESRTGYDGNQDGGVLSVTYYVRWQHVSGDMGSQ
jgi:hypothetical protein